MSSSQWAPPKSHHQGGSKGLYDDFCDLGGPRASPSRKSHRRGFRTTPTMTFAMWGALGDPQVAKVIVVGFRTTPTMTFATWEALGPVE